MATASRSSAPDRRGQASPTAALVAVAAVALALSLYATVFAGIVPSSDREVAEPTLTRVHDAVAAAGVVEPARIESGVDAGPVGWTLRVELRVDERRWAVGSPPSAEAEAQSAGRRVAVRVARGRVRAGWLRVVLHR